MASNEDVTVDDARRGRVSSVCALRNGVAGEVKLRPGDVRSKDLQTRNEFVSHMIEHLAWRLGLEAEVAWPNDDWYALGKAIGDQLAPLLDGRSSGRALGVIDDGACMVSIDRSATPGAELVSSGVDLDWFLGCRCEQLPNGAPLLAMLRGLAVASGVSIQVEIASFEDPHHTWEAAWRGVGHALFSMSETLSEHANAEESSAGRVAHRDFGFVDGFRVLASDRQQVSLIRETEESRCEVELELDSKSFECEIHSAAGASINGIAVLLARFFDRAGLGARIRFESRALTSTHVVAEDTGTTIGAALRVLAVERMNALGIEGSGSSVTDWINDSQIRIGVSFEGRKFVKFVPIDWTMTELRRQMIGQTLADGAYSEDLDDFLDGIASGMGCSIVALWAPTSDADAAWNALFDGLGDAFAGVLTRNSTRKRLITSVKASLA